MQNCLDMKKYLFINLVALLSLVLTGCEKKNEPCQCTQEHLTKATVDFRVPKNVWTYDQDNAWFSAVYETEKLTEYVYDYGTWTVSHEYNPGTEDAFLIQLPELRFLLDEASGAYYTQRIDYEVGVGYVRVYVTNSDYTYYENWQPDEMYFHMQIVY